MQQKTVRRTGFKKGASAMINAALALKQREAEIHGIKTHEILDPVRYLK
jgi:CRP-like cAMP-binding protein